MLWKCCCKVTRELCLHTWFQIVLTHAPAAVTAGLSVWVTTLRCYLARLGLDECGWSMHCCRRGAALCVSKRTWVPRQM